MNWEHHGMPILSPRGMAPIPWAVIAPHARQAMINHGQTLERLAERGGLAAHEAVAIIEDRRWHWMDDEYAATVLATHVRAERAGGT